MFTAILHMKRLMRRERSFHMEKLEKNFGFGCMRLPMNGEEVDLAQPCKLCHSVRGRI